MSRPRLLDLFCGAGGAAVGYHRAGFDLVGVDNKRQSHYPYEFWQLDALDVIDRLQIGQTFHGKTLADFDAIHASPPCQGYSRMRHLPWLRDREYPLLIDPVRQLLRATGLPWVIENVEDAPLQKGGGLFGIHGVVLCGTMFGLDVYRHRPFESSVQFPQPRHPRHEKTIQAGRLLGGRADVRRGVTVWQENGGVAGNFGNLDRARAAMDIDWMTAAELSQAIPPAYTQWIGEQLLAALAVTP
jgi:DNA (cytosine-5)-methyltransferase 1